jgi:hypothetical protein
MRKLFLILFTGLCLAASCWAQDEVRVILVKEKFADSTFVFELDGSEYRAITAQKMHDVLGWKIDLDALKVTHEKTLEKHRQYVDVSESRFAEAQRLIELAEKKAAEQEAFWKGEYQKELTLRNKLAKDLSRCTGKILWFRICTF